MYPGARRAGSAGLHPARRPPLRAPLDPARRRAESGEGGWLAGWRPGSGTALDAAGPQPAMRGCGMAGMRPRWGGGRSAPAAAAAGACNAAGRLPGTACRHVGGRERGWVWIRRLAIAGPSARLNTPRSAPAPMTPSTAAKSAAARAEQRRGGGVAMPAGRHLG